MKGTALKRAKEPIGIVISAWPSTEEKTVFSAYVWGPAPGATEDKGPKAG